MAAGGACGHRRVRDLAAAEPGRRGRTAGAGERAAADLIRYQVPDFRQPASFAGKRTVVVGSGHSAATAVIELARIAEAYLDLDATLQAPRRIAAEIDPNVHSCGTVAATGAKDLAHPEPGLYMVGMKSNGRAPTFLAMTGYEQVRSVAAELVGEHEAAARVT